MPAMASVKSLSSAASDVYKRQAKPEASKIEFNVNTASVFTNHAERDKHIASGDFLNAAKFAKATFLGEGKDPWGGYRAGFEGTTSIKRSDFGKQKDLGPASDAVELYVSFEGVKAK